MNRFFWLAATILVLFTLLCGAQVPSPDIDGSWLGTMDLGGPKLRILLKLATTDGILKAEVFSVDQGNTRLPATVTRDGASIKVLMKSAGSTIDGKFDPDFTRLDSTFTQGNKSFPLVLTRVPREAAVAPPRRPQNPVRPFPYQEEDVSYPNPAAGGIKFAATLTIPPGKGPFPAVFLITGSGPQDRDEAMMDHKPFLVLSDYLTRRGVVVLRADDRGIAKSEGKFAGATTADFATDAEAALAYLKTRPEVDHQKTGLIGHSEGGAIAPLIASRNRDVAFIVMLAGPGVPGDQIVMQQTIAMGKAAGGTPEQVDVTAKRERAVLDLVLQEKDASVAQAKLKEQFSLPDPTAKQLTTAWYRYFLAYDPAVALRKVQCPVLALDGTKDTQVPSDLNLPAVRKALEEGGNKHYEIVEIPGLNHIFQVAKTGLPDEYSTIEETISPLVLEKVAAWIAKQ